MENFAFWWPPYAPRLSEGGGTKGCFKLLLRSQQYIALNLRHWAFKSAGSCCMWCFIVFLIPTPLHLYLKSTLPSPLCPSSPAPTAGTSVPSAATHPAAIPTCKRAPARRDWPRTSSGATFPTWSTTRRTAPSSTPTRLSLPPPLRPRCRPGTWVRAWRMEGASKMDF